jgi:hypothetical protein
LINVEALKVLDALPFREADYVTDHYFKVAKGRKRPTVSK